MRFVQFPTPRLRPTRWIPTAAAAGGPVEETPVPGGAIAGGNGPVAQVSVPQGGGSAAGPNQDTVRVAVPQGGALAAGPAPTVRVPVAQGGAIGAGNSPTIRVSVPQGGALAAGNGPTVQIGVTQGGASTGGFGPTVRVTIGQGGGTAGGYGPTDGSAVSETPVPGGAVAGGNGPVVRVSVDKTFGSVKGVGSSGVSEGFKQVFLHTLSEPATVKKLTVWSTGGGSNQVLKGVIYANSGGVPGALLAVTDEVTILTTTREQVDLPFSSHVSLAAGSYWLGFHAGATHVGANLAYTDVGSGRVYSVDAYANGPSDPFGAVDGQDSLRFDVLATYVSPILVGGNAPTVRVSLAQGGATAAGNAPVIRTTIGQGGASTGGFGPTVRVAVPQGGGSAGGPSIFEATAMGTAANVVITELAGGAVVSTANLNGHNVVVVPTTPTNDASGTEVSTQSVSGSESSGASVTITG